MGCDIVLDADGNLYLSTGDDTNPFQSDGYTPIDERPERNPAFHTQRGSGNTNDLRGKVLRITPLADGGYSVPDGNLFAPGSDEARPEIHAMRSAGIRRDTDGHRRHPVPQGGAGPGPRPRPATTASTSAERPRSFSGNAAELDLKIQNALTPGQSFIVVPFLNSPNLANWPNWADQMNAEAEVARSAGMRYGYHNHAHEFTIDLGGGVTPWEVLTSRLDPPWCTWRSTSSGW